MGEDELKWFYVGNGQLRAKDGDGWTDQYQDLDGPPKAPEVEVTQTPDTVEPDLVGSEPRKRRLASFGTLCATAVHALVAGVIFGTVRLVRLDAAAGRAIAALWRLIALRLRKSSASGGLPLRRGRHRTGSRHRLVDQRREAEGQGEALTPSAR